MPHHDVPGGHGRHVHLPERVAVERPQLTPARAVAGVDGCPGGWLVVRWELAEARLNSRVCQDFLAVLAATEECKVVAVDIPIGLTDSGPRRCDLEARSILGRRGVTVFAAPLRGMLAARHRQEASSVRLQVDGKGVGAQAFAIVGKVRQVDEAMSPALQRRVVEVHPELCFWALAGAIMPESKRTPAGYARRLAALQAVLPPLDVSGLQVARSKAAPDDLLDALAAAWTARRVAEGMASRVPEQPRLDAKGLRMEMWF